MRTIAIYNSKGGCGKTTCSTSLAACLAAIGERTLLVDLDAQGHCAMALGLEPQQTPRGIADLLDAGPTNNLQVRDVASAAAPRLEVIAADPRLNLLRQRTGFHFSRLSAALDGASRSYGWCIIDCATTMDALTRAALELADDVIVPVETTYLGLLSLPSLLASLSAMRDRHGQRLRLRLLPTMYDPRTRLAREVLGELRGRFAPKMSTCTIHTNTRLAEAAGTGQAIAEYDPASRGGRDFLNLMKELMGGRAVLPASEGQTPAVARSVEMAARARQLAGMAVRHLHLGSGAAKGVQSLAQKLRTIYGVAQVEGGVRFTASFDAAEEVLLAGDFNDWKPQRLEVDARGNWQARVELKPGRYRYRYVVDGRWVSDPYNSQTEPNEFGEPNNIVEVTESLQHAA